MAAPTKEEYEEALRNAAYLGDTIIRERKHRESLINELCTSQNLLNQYERLLSNQKEIVQKYEIYKEIRNENLC